jgi:hypothetical protein
MQPGQPQFIDPNAVKGDLAAAEREAQFVNQEQVIAAALFAKQLQTDLFGIKSRAVGEGLKVPDVDMSKVMPSNIYRTFRPVGGPPSMAAASAPAAPLPSPIPVIQAPVMQAPVAAPVLPVEPDNQLEFNFNKVTRYEDVVESIEKLQSKIDIINVKLDNLIQDKKKLNPTHPKDGT